MTITRAYSRTVGAATTLLVAQVVLCVPLYVNAASLPAEASVRITTRPSALGTISVFKVNVANPQKNAKAIDAKPQKRALPGRLLDTANGEIIQPAVFTITGMPSQTFSVSMPQSGISSSASGSVEFTDFAHDAGSTPTIGVGGSTEFAVGARVKFTPSSGVSVAQPQTQNQAENKPEPTSAQKAKLLKRNPFGVQGVQDGFMNVLVSYN